MVNPDPYRLDEFRLLVNDDGLLAGAGMFGTPDSLLQYDRFIVFTPQDPVKANLACRPVYIFTISVHVPASGNLI